MLHTVRWGRNERSVENKGDTSYHLEYGNKQHPYNKALFIFSRLTTGQHNRLILSIMLKVNRFLCSQNVFRHPDFSFLEYHIFKQDVIFCQIKYAPINCAYRYLNKLIKPIHLIFCHDRTNIMTIAAVVVGRIRAT